MTIAKILHITNPMKIIMKTFNININTINEVKNFVNIVTKCDYDVDIISGRYAIDAKSIMGIFSLDLLNKIEMTVHCDECCDELLNALGSIVVD